MARYPVLSRESGHFPNAAARDPPRQHRGQCKTHVSHDLWVGRVPPSHGMLEECKQQLRSSKIEMAEKLEVGAMVEIPSAAICANALAREVDFFSIGTNDLIQYALAVDRVNEKIAYLYEPTHPAILRLLKMVADAAHANHIWVGVCGEMAGDVALVPLLLGLGMDELSASATLVPRVKRAVQSLTIPECRELVEETLKLNTASEILERCLQLADSRYGDLLG